VDTIEGEPVMQTRRALPLAATLGLLGLLGPVPGAAAQAIPGEKVNVPPGFRAERLYTVPKDKQGSWVSLTVDGKGRLIASDQGGLGLYRIEVKGSEVAVEKVPVPVSGAQGLLWAFDALYVGVNGKGSGLWKVTDSDGDDVLDQAEQLFALNGAGEHGPHAVILAEDGQGIYFAAGNHTDPPAGLTGHRLMRNWDEDHLLPRQWDAKGHARGRLAPGGWIARVSPDGRERVIVSSGYRNQYDIALNRHGEMFTFDSDMEWDLGSPWYRPTRICHATSGSEFGWRSGTGKWPSHYADSLPATADIGPASPTGVLFGTGAKFPARWQDAFFALDWTYGTIWACHLTPEGSSYRADVEEFVSGTPLPVTDAVIGKDGAFYFVVGGRGTPSALYRVTYTGDESTAPASGGDAGASARALRRSLEAFHGRQDPAAVETLWPHLGSGDRFLRYAARVALESQPVDAWKARALKETRPQALVSAMVALARQGPKAVQPDLLEALSRLDLKALPVPLLLEALRAYELAFIRLGEPAAPAPLAARFAALYPHEDEDVNGELVQLLVYLKDPAVVARTMGLIASAGPSPKPRWLTVLRRNTGYGGVAEKLLANMPPLQAIHYAFVLRNATAGWTLPLRRAYFEVLHQYENNFQGGNSFRGFLQNTRRDAVALLNEEEKKALGALILELPKPVANLDKLPQPKGPGRAWTVAEFLPQVESGLSKRNFEEGRRAFRAARCVACHRLAGEGGDTGPDLTGLAGRFGVKDILESIFEPSKVVSDQYQALVIRTKDGDVVTGRVLQEQKGKLILATDLLHPDRTVEILKESIAETRPSALSPMPDKLADPLNAEEILDLIAYMLSGGNPKHGMFK
jgi:putative heme-binding domain-containing protein